MAFTPRTRDEIRATILANWAANYAAATTPRVLLTTAGSDAFLEAAALAVELEGLEAFAAQVALDILPDQASPDAVRRFSYVYNVPPRRGRRARITTGVTGTPLATVAIPTGTQIATPDGVLFGVTDASVVLDSFGDAAMYAVAVDAGTDGNVAVGTQLTFTVAPSGLDPVATVASLDTEGVNVEDTASLAQRIVDHLRERPASGNRADWRDWVTGYRGTTIAEAYVYPLLQPPASTPGTGTENALGCVTVVVVGPAQGDSTTNTRIVPYDDGSGRAAGAPVLRVIDYLLGLRDADGAITATGNRLPPVTMNDWTVEAINTQSVNVVVAITPTASNAFPFTATPTVDASSSASSLVVVGDYSITGTDLSGFDALVFIGTSNIRGGYERTTLGTGSYNGGTGNTTFSVSLTAAPIAASTVHPAPPCWDALRTAVFAYFDGLGPGDTTTPSRWPTQDVSGRSTLYRTALAGRITDIAGVLSASITTPPTDTTPIAKTVITLGTLLVTP